MRMRFVGPIIHLVEGHYLNWIKQVQLRQRQSSGSSVKSEICACLHELYKRTNVTKISWFKKTYYKMTQVLKEKSCNEI